MLVELLMLYSLLILVLSFIEMNSSDFFLLLLIFFCLYSFSFIFGDNSELRLRKLFPGCQLLFLVSKESNPSFPSKHSRIFAKLLLKRVTVQQVCAVICQL